MARNKNTLGGRDVTRKLFDKSIEWYRKCNHVIPAACSTLAKTPSRLIENVSPFCCSRANGSHFTDLDENKWLDCEMAMGTVAWGYNPPFLTEALIKQIEKGISFSVAGDNEYQYAEMLLNKFSCYDSVKFFKNGADSVYAAVRASRFLSKKNGVLSCEYHGWLDWSCFHYYGKEPQAYGIPDNIKYTSMHCEADKEAIMKQLIATNNELACVVLCPGSFLKEDLEVIIKECHHYNIFVIFDEVTSGVRYGYRGVSGAYDLYPDYLCISKGLTNGLPLAVCMGKCESILIMEELKISNAHSSENLSIAAAIACEQEMSISPVWPTWKTQGEKVMDHIRLQIEKWDLSQKLFLKGYPGNFHVYSQNDFYTDPFRDCLIRMLSTEGIFSKGFILFSAAHSIEEIELTGQIICECIEKYANIID